MTFQNSTGNLSQYYLGGPVGILPGQNMFATDSTRAGLLAARQSFVGMLNNIFASSAFAIDNPAAVEALAMTSPQPGAMIWRQAQESTYIQPLPPPSEWTKQVYDIEGRDALLSDPVFSALVLNGLRPRVLVNGLTAADAPQWSVWEASLDNVGAGNSTAAYIAANPEQVFALAQTYAFHVASMNARNLLLQQVNPITSGQRVLVDADPANSNFWTVWTYSPGSTGADSYGFVLTDLQLYRTADFFSLVDWYASGYSASVPPVVRYATEVARNVAENPSPKNLFVRIDDDGDGRWMWTAYDPTTSTWSIVARQNGTIALSASFYDASRSVLINDPLPSNALAIIPVRDGSWELKVMFNALQDSSVLTNLQVNELFFSMLHFVHAQQDQVPWAFKTSFLNVGGYNTALTATPVTPIDNSENLLEYITEVKPYRVVIRNFTQVYTLTDNAVTQSSDFDFPQYYDTARDETRWLDPTNAADLAIIQSTRPWSDWYSTYLKTGLDPANYEASTWNATRRFNITMRFDRVDHMPVLALAKFTYDGSTTSFSLPIDTTGQLVSVTVDGETATTGWTADTDSVTFTGTLKLGAEIEVTIRQNVTAGYEADRINQYYTPTVGMPEKNVRQMMGLNFQGDYYDGGALSETNSEDFEIDGNAGTTDAVIDGSGLSGAQNGLPEELILPGTNESLRITMAEGANTSVVQLASGALTLLSNHSWSMAQARPSWELFAPSEIGDYDTRPLEETTYDTLFTQDYEPDQDGDYKDIYVMASGAYEYLRWRPSGFLSADFQSTDTSFTVTVEPTRTPLPVPEPENNKPGVVWVGSERIEYFGLDHDVANSVWVLSQLRRGTHSTGQSNEVRAVTRAVGDGSTVSFTLNGSAESTVAVVIWQQLVNTSGQPVISDGYTGFNIPVPKVQGTDYTLSLSNGNTVVTFKTPPAVGADIFISRTVGMYAEQGMPVYDGTIRYDRIPTTSDSSSGGDGSSSDSEEEPYVFTALFAGYNGSSESMTVIAGEMPFFNTTPCSGLTETQYFLPGLPGCAIARPDTPATNHIIYAAMNHGSTPFASWTFDGTTARPNPVTYMDGALPVNNGDYVSFYAVPLETDNYWFSYIPDPNNSNNTGVWDSQPPIDLGAALANPVTVALVTSISAGSNTVTSAINFPGYP